MYNNDEISNIISDLINDNKLNKISDNLYLSNRQINILNRYGINYKKYSSIRNLIYDVEMILLESSDCDDLEMLSSELSEFNYYHNTNK